MARRNTKGQAGFIITLELVLIFTILGLGVMVGIVAIRNALFKFFLHKKSAEIYVVDSDPAGQKVLGKAFDLDEHEAPRLQFVDKGVDFGGVTVNRRVIIGVRDDRFTTRHRIFYENSANCGSTDLGGGTCTTASCQPCIVENGNEEGDNLGIGFAAVDALDSGGDIAAVAAPIVQAGGIGYLYPMQGGPSYGIGRDVDSGTGLPGTLYRETVDSCDPAAIRSVWTSQTVVSGEPCGGLPGGAVIAAAKCPPGADGDAIGDPCNVPPADSRCVTSGTCADGTGCSNNAECGLATPCTTGALQCACPDTANGNPADDWIEFGANCCPPGSTESAPGQCTIGNDGTIRIAEPVLNAGGDNALSIYVAPFFVNFPVEIDATFEATEPGGFEGAPPGPVIPGGIDVDTIEFTTPPANGENGPP